MSTRAGRRRWIGIVLVVPVLLVGVLVATNGVPGGRASDTPTESADTRASATTPGGATPSATSVHDAMRWDTSLAVALPVSSVHGPAELTPSRAAGFDHGLDGATLAAAHLLARTSPSVGPRVFGPTIEEQVRGPNREALASAVRSSYDADAAASGITDGGPLPGADAQVAGYRLLHAGDDAPVIEVVMTSAGLQAEKRAVAVRVSLQWSDGDWQLVAPPRGDWGTVTTVVAAPVVDLQTYDGSS